MARKQYDVEVNGTRTVLNLSDEDAKTRGLTDKDLAKAAAKPANKARTAANKSDS